MLVGVPREAKNHEYRVASTPAGVRELVHHGHDVLVETVRGQDGSLPLLAPMSEVAGRMARRSARTASNARRAAAVCCSAGCRRVRGAGDSGVW